MNNRVVLLHPPTRASSDYFPLGLAILNAVLKKNHYEVRIVDAAAPMKRLNNKQTIREIKDFEPMFVGITLTLDFIVDKYQLINEIKKSGFPVIAGGPHVNYLPDEVLNLSDVDIAAIGEGEETLVEIAECFQGKRALEDIDGIGFKKNGNVIYTRKRELISDLDSIPYPDYHDFPIREYTGSDDPASSRIFWRIMTSRGCPFNCFFCTSNQVFGRKYRLSSARRMFEEIRYMHEEYGAPSVALEDNEPMRDKQRISKLCDLLMESDLKVNISSRSRIDSIDAELLKKMKVAGFNRMTFGIESGDEETLRGINKKYSLTTILHGFEEVTTSGFPVINFNNIIGFPWETNKHLENTIEMNQKVPKGVEYFATACTPIPYPASDLYEQYYEEYGFKDWWLDNKYHEELPSVVEVRPFYMNFMPSLITHDMKVNFWKYSKKMKKKIIKTKFTIQLLHLQGKMPKYLLWILSNLCRFSAWVDIRAPFLERLLFAPFSQKKLAKMAKKYNFTTR